MANARTGYLSTDAVVEQETRGGRVGYMSTDAVVEQERRDGRVGYMSVDVVMSQYSETFPVYGPQYYSLRNDFLVLFVPRKR